MEGNELDTQLFNVRTSVQAHISKEDMIIILFAIQPESGHISVATRDYHSISYTLLSNKNMGLLFSCSSITVTLGFFVVTAYFTYFSTAPQVAFTPNHISIVQSHPFSNWLQV